MEQVKCCTKCGEAKKLSEFGKRGLSKDGLSYWCRECASAQKKLYYSANKEEIKIRAVAYMQSHRKERNEKQKVYQKTHLEAYKAYQKVYRITHREARNKYSKAYYIAHSEEQKAQRRKHYQNNREQYIARAQAWYEANPEKKLASVKAWNDTHPEVRHAIGHRHRARKANAEGDANVEQIAARWDYYSGKCYICGADAVETDHVIPLAKGGSNWPANLRPICRSCNARKAAKRPYNATPSIAGA